MTELRRQLLIGCGYPLRPLHGGAHPEGMTSDQRYRKKMSTIHTTNRWEALTTLDVNPECDPDLWCDLNAATPWIARPRGKSAFHELEGDYWDEIHAYEVLEHLGRQGDAHSFFAHFSEIWRLLKPGGQLLATVPSKRSGFFWGDPSHSRAIVEESLVFLDQSEYIRQCDGAQATGMSDFRSIYKADFKLIDRSDTGGSLYFILEAVKPSRWVLRTAL
jgi:hypothetical protein